MLAQSLSQAKLLADSAEFLIHEDRNLNLAHQLNQQAKNYYELNNHFDGQVHCQINASCLLAQNDFFEEGLQLIEDLEQAIPVRIAPESRLAGVLYGALAWNLWGLARYDEAYAAAVKGTAILKKLQEWDRFVDASLLATYSIYYNNKSNFTDIDQHIQETYEIAQQYLPPSRMAFKYIYQLYGAILYQQGRMDQAIELTHKGLNYEYQLLVEEHRKKDSLIVAKYYNNLGRMYAEQGDVVQGISYYKNSFTMYRHLNRPSELIKLCTRIGDLYLRKEKREDADLYYSKIPSYIPYMPKNPITQLRENNFEHMAMARYYLHFSLNDSLLQYYQQQLPYIKKHQLAVDKAYINIGNAHEAKKNYQLAEDFYQKALALEEEKYKHKGTKIASMYFRLGRLAAKMEHPDLAIAYMDSVIHMLDASPEPQKDKIQLLEYLLDKSIALEAYQHRGEAFMEIGNLHQAHTDFGTVILLANYLRDNYTDSESKLVSTNKLRPVYEKAAATAWNLHKNDATDESYKMTIFDYAEHSKATLLNENILKFRNHYTQGGIGIPKELLQQEEKYILQIDQCKEHIIEAKKEQNNKKEALYLEKMLHLEQTLDSFEQQLQEQYPSYRSWDHGRDSIVSPKEVQQHLNEEDVLVEYFISDNHFFIIYISKDQVKIKEVEDYNPRHYKSKIRNLRRTLSNIEFILGYGEEAYAVFCEEAHWFYKNYLEDDILKGKSHLIIIPDRNLHYIPFEVLLTKPVQNKKEVDYKELSYLIHEYSINYEYSAAIMVNTQKRPNTSSGRILGFAATYDKKFSYEQLPKSLKKERTKEEIELHNTAIEIPGTLQELEELQYYFAGDFFAKQQASEHRFKEALHDQEYSIIHLAMHGVVDYDYPAYSSLMFTENLDSLEDNLLYSYETQHLNGMNANLVVLSACKTGYGKYAQGEGIISLGRSFMYAGIPSIVMTLWELNDQTSVEVMQLFYYNLVAGQTKDRAMQNAKIDYLKNSKGFTAHPFFWASFVCIGNQHPIPLDYRPYAWYWWAGFGIVVLIFIAWIWKRKINS